MAMTAQAATRMYIIWCLLPPLNRRVNLHSSKLCPFRICRTLVYRSSFGDVFVTFLLQGENEHHVFVDMMEQVTGCKVGITRVRLLYCALASVGLLLITTALQVLKGNPTSIPLSDHDAINFRKRAMEEDHELGFRAHHHSGPARKEGNLIRDAHETDKKHEGNKELALQNGTLSVNTVVNYARWDAQVGCHSFRNKHNSRSSLSRSPSLQSGKVDNCTALRMQHVSVLVKEWTWIPETLNNLYSCDCDLTCLWTNSDALEMTPDALLYETSSPPFGERRQGEPWRVFMDLEPGRKRADSQDLFVSYHAGDDLQVTYAGASFHPIRSYHISSLKHDEVLVYWSSSRCLPARQATAAQVLKLLPHHSFGKCHNNVGGPNMELHMYPECALNHKAPGHSWSQSLHCMMSHYKFVLAIENTRAESYVTEKLFYALDAGAVPIYFGAPNVLELVPPNSVIEGDRFSSTEELAAYVKRVANNPVLYAEFHAWRRCGVMGPYGKTRAVSLDSLPCRLCAHVSRLGGRSA